MKPDGKPGRHHLKRTTENALRAVLYNREQYDIDGKTRNFLNSCGLPVCKPRNFIDIGGLCLHLKHILQGRPIRDLCPCSKKEATKLLKNPTHHSVRKR